MTQKSAEGLPEITLKTVKRPVEDWEKYDYFYYLLRQEGEPEIPLSNPQYYALTVFEKHNPNSLVYTRSIARKIQSYNGATYGADELVSGEQFVAETMHRLSQPNLLGTMLQPEIYGPHIVGWRLAAVVKSSSLIDEVSSAQLAKKSGAIARFFSR